MKKQKVLVIIGPTASGKTKLSIALGKKFQSEIISGDSMQLYKHLDIGTAKVTPKEMEGIPHYLIDYKNFDESFSVSEFQTLVRKEISTIASHHHLPLICGGTGLYIRAALYDYKFDEHERDATFKEHYEQYTNEQLHDYLKTIDPKSADEIHPNNRVRVLRAIEIYETTGIPKSKSIEADLSESLYDLCVLGLNMEREQLYNRINERVDQMFEAGLLDEFKTVVDLGATKEMQSMKAIGYQELFDYLSCDKSLDEVKELIKLHSRRYAKRQMTWFKHQMPVHWLEVDINNFEKTIEEAIEIVSQWLEA